MAKINSFLDKLDKKYGQDVLIPADSEFCKEVETVPTGSYMLDDLLKVNGLPRGRIIQYAGKESSGKTFLAMLAIKEWQKKAPKNFGIFIDAEQTFDRKWAESLGLDLERLRVIPENGGKEIFNMLNGKPDSKGKWVGGILDEVIENGGADETGLGIIVLDSVAAIETPMESTSEAGKFNIAPMGRFLPPELKKLVPRLARSKVIFIAINQVRVNIGQQWGNPETTTGGRAWKHYCSIMLNLTASEAKAGKIFDEHDKDSVIGHYITARVDKCKVSSAAHSKCSVGIEYVKGMHSPAEELQELAKKYGIIERPNNRTYIYGDQKWTSADEFKTAFQDEKEQVEVWEKIQEVRSSGMLVIKDDSAETEIGD